MYSATILQVKKPKTAPSITLGRLIPSKMVVMKKGAVASNACDGARGDLPPPRRFEALRPVKRLFSLLDDNAIAGRTLA